MSINLKALAIRQLCSIRTRLILQLTLVITLVCGLFAIVDIKQKTRQVEAELYDHIHTILEIETDALAIPLWNFDSDEIKRQLDLFVAHRDIVSASVLQSSIEEFDQIVAEAGHDMAIGHSRQDIENTTNRRDLGVDMALKGHRHAFLTSEISHNGEPIGRLKVELSHDRIDGVRDAVIWYHFNQFLIITSTIALTIAFAVTGFVRPILSITNTMGRLAGGDLNVTIPATDRRDEIGEMAQALKVFRANAAQLQTALDKERELSGLQRQFVSMVSHEFRTPLAIIDGNAQRIMRRHDKIGVDQLLSSLGKIRTSVVRLTELMESVLNTARLEEGRIAFEPKPCQVADMIGEMVCSFGELNVDRDIILDIEKLPNDIVADGKLLRQIFSNLMSNAVKYSQDGSKIWVVGRLSEEDELAITFQDQGVGIPAPELEQLFQRFFRASTSTGIAGSGIGLNLAKHFVDLHGGRIDVESTVNAGTTFTVRLPFIDPANRMAANAA